MANKSSPHFAGLQITLDHTLPAVLAHVAGQFGSAPFLITEDGRTLSFAGFASRVDRLSAALIVRGLDHGDRAAIWAPNGLEWILAACAIESIGGIMVPINTRFKGEEAAFALEKTRAKFLFTVTSFLGNDYRAMLSTARGDPSPTGPVSGLPALRHLVCYDDTVQLDEFEACKCPPVTLLERKMAVTPATIADVLFTSGTTGEPKGAMHDHGQALWVAGIWNEANDLRAGDRMIIINPFFHSFGYRSGWVSALVAGITVYPVAIFDAETVLETIERERITVLMGPPTLFFALLDHPRLSEFDLSSLRVGHTGAANVPVELIRAGRDVFGFDIFLTSFGQTESSALISVNRPTDPFETIAHTVGLPLPGVQLKLANVQDGADDINASGELLVRGPNVMRGYFEDAEQTAATIDADGWLHTGDVASIAPDGTVRILDRLKDVVIVGGFNAYPAEVETMLRRHPAIADVCVFGLPDARMGEVCAACVVLEPGEVLFLPDLVAWSRQRMANYKVPKRLYLVDDFPRTPLGKVQKFLLRELLMAQDRASN